MYKFLIAYPDRSVSPPAVQRQARLAYLLLQMWIIVLLIHLGDELEIDGEILFYLQ